MPLMDRIKIKDFLSFSYSEKYTFIEKLQQKRLTELTLARLSKTKQTKSAKRNLKKRGKKVKDPKQVAITALKKLSSAQIKIIKDMII